MVAEGDGLTVMLEVVAIQPEISVNVNVTLPADTPVTKPAAVTVAIAGVLLIQEPPELGLRFKVEPMHNVGDGELTTGNALMVTLAVVVLGHVPFVKL